MRVPRPCVRSVPGLIILAGADRFGIAHTMTLLLLAVLVLAVPALCGAFDERETETLASLAARAPSPARGRLAKRAWFNYDEWKVRGVNLGGW